MSKDGDLSGIYFKKKSNDNMNLKKNDNNIKITIKQGIIKKRGHSINNN